MANIFDYINWRGDLTMIDDPFNDIDALILSELIYVDFENIVPSAFNSKSLTLKEASNLFFEIKDVDSYLNKVSFTKEAISLLKEMANKPRYQSIRLYNYVNELDSDCIKQFSAITFQLDDFSIYVAYRGTDDTILGWQEDFMMTYQFPVASQIRALEYLETVSQYNYPIEFKTVCNRLNNHKTEALKKYLKIKRNNLSIRVGGHSKGGNLALYAASNVNKKIANSILAVYNNDGPGFEYNLDNLKSYELIKDKIIKYVPEGSIFGIMLENIEQAKIVKSNAKGLMQHSGFTWQVIGTSFEESDKLDNDSLAMYDAFNNWLLKVDIKTRKEAVETLFSILTVANIKTLNDFTDKSMAHFMIALKELKHLDSDSRNSLIDFLKILFLEVNNCRKEYKNKE